MSTPSWHHADPGAIIMPTDANDIARCLSDIRDTLVAMNANLSTAIGLIGVNTTDIGTLGSNSTTLENSVQTLESAFIKMTADISRITIPSSTTPPSGARKPKLSEPAKFDGTDKNKAVSFRVALMHYLRVSYPSSTVDEQIAFIISCLDGKAQEWLEPYLEEDVVRGNAVAWLHDVDGFWEQFNARWSVQNRTENFRAKLRALKQSKGVQEYFKDFQTYSQGLGYNDISLRDMFYDGLSIKIKEMLMAQDYDHSAATVTLQLLAEKALKIDQRLEQFAAQNKGHSSSTASSSKEKASTSTASPGQARDKMSVGEKVYQIGSDGKAKKGTITKIGKNKKGFAVPTVKWDDGTTEDSTFKSLKKDEYPNPSPSAPKPKSQGPAPMELDAAKSKGKSPIICSTCGGKGHYSSQCPSKAYSGQGATISEDESEKEDL